MNREFEFLKTINNISKSPFLGDDCAYLKKYSLVLSQDTLVEDVHFSLNYMTPCEIARKALLVNISDILASGAKPEYFSIGLSGNLDSDFVEQFYRGLNITAKEFGLELIGGDLTKSQKIMISITVLGSSKDRKISSRKNAKAGQIIAVAGEFGSSAKGLLELQEGLSDSEFIKIHKSPILHPMVSQKIAQNVQSDYAMMDSSDGLADCLYQISNQSGVKFCVEYSKIPKKIDDKNLVLYGGEDYSLVVCLDREFIDYDLPELIQIGTVENGSGVFLDGKALEYQSFEHFKSA